MLCMGPCSVTFACRYFCKRLIDIDVGEGTSGMSADVPRFGLEIHLVSNAMLDEQIFINRFCEIEDLSLFTDRLLANIH